jgi:hypothetical protein
MYGVTANTDTRHRQEMLKIYEISEILSFLEK